MQCKAKRSNGQPCTRPAIKGGTVCMTHGGAAPQVREAAKLRLAALVDPAITQLAKLVKSKQGPVSLGAVRDVLDRNGFKPVEKREDVTDYAGQLGDWTQEELEVALDLQRRRRERLAAAATTADVDRSGDSSPEAE